MSYILSSGILIMTSKKDVKPTFNKGARKANFKKVESKVSPDVGMEALDNIDNYHNTVVLSLDKAIYLHLVKKFGKEKVNLEMNQRMEDADPAYKRTFISGFIPDED